jgi:hypothetical protein
VHGPEDCFCVAVRVCGVDVALDHVVVHQAVNDVGALALGGADDRRVEQQMSLVDEAVDADAFALAEVLERVVGVSRAGLKPASLHPSRRARARESLWPLDAVGFQYENQSSARWGASCPRQGNLPTQSGSQRYR